MFTTSLASKPTRLPNTTYAAVLRQDSKYDVIDACRSSMTEFD